jgi:hypothetical protein
MFPQNKYIGPMSKKTDHTPRFNIGHVIGRKGVHVDNMQKTSSGQEVWRIRSGSYVVNVVTSASSTAIMDDAVKIYSPALERLAKR